MTIKTQAQLQIAIASGLPSDNKKEVSVKNPVYKIWKDLSEKTFPENLSFCDSKSKTASQIYPDSEDKDEDEEKEEPDQDEQQEEEEEEEEEEDQDQEKDQDQEQDQDDNDVDIDLGYGDDNDGDLSGFRTPNLFQNPIIFYRGYATEDELDQHRAALAQRL